MKERGFNTMDVITTAKITLTAIATALVTYLGGNSNMLILLVMLMLGDIISGLIIAASNGEISSKRLRIGLVRKAMSFWIIFLAAQLDLILVDFRHGMPMIVNGFEIKVSLFFIAYACLEEFISVLENCERLGVPMPRWVLGILKSVDTSIDRKLPDVLINFLNEKFHLQINEDDSNINDDTTNKEGGGQNGSDDNQVDNSICSDDIADKDGDGQIETTEEDR